MPGMGWVVGLVAAVVLVSAYLTWTAARVDRLHARIALDAEDDEREAAENDLTRQLRLVPLEPDDPAAEAVISASRRLALARQVHTDLVRDALSLRRRPLIRLLGMARKHEAPRYFDIDDPILNTRPGLSVG